MNIRSLGGLLILGVCALLSSCCTWLDLTKKDLTSAAPEERWVPIHPVDFTPTEYCLNYSEEDHVFTAYELIDVALTNNPLTSRSWNLARAAAFNLGVAESALYPVLADTETFFEQKITGGLGAAAASVNTSNGTTGSTSGSGSGVLPFTRAMQSNLTLSYLLLDFGGRSASIEAARQALWQADWTHNRTLQDVIVSVLDSYYAHLAAEALMKSRELDLANAATSLDAARQQFSVGVNTKVDVLQAEAQYANNQSQLQFAIGNVRITLGQLARAIGLPANTQLTINPLPEQFFLERIGADVEELMAVAVEKRPDLAATYSSFRQAQEEIIVARSAGLPTFTAQGFITRNNIFNQSGLNSTVYNGSLNLNIPIFSGFLYQYQTASAKANARAAYFNFLDGESSVFLDVVTSYYTYDTAIATMYYSGEYLRYAQEAYDALLIGYKEGTSSILDLLTAQSTLADARTQWIQARMQFATSIAQVAYATGTL